MQTVQALPRKHTKHCRFVHDRYEALSQLPTQGIIAEVGVLAGDLSDWLLQKMNPSELHLIDIFRCDDYLQPKRFKKSQNFSFVVDRFKDQIESGKVILKKGNSWDMMATYPDNYFDLIYIDASHDYRSVQNDLHESVKKIKDTGFIIMNDYIMYDHFARIDYGVVQATNEFCIEYKWEFAYFAFHPNLFCDVVLKKMILKPVSKP